VGNGPAGPIHLIVDGSTAGTSNVLEYPILGYDMSTVSGADNGLGMPIHLVALDLMNAQWVGGANDVTYTLTEVPGFELVIPAGGVTFPDGNREGF